jgi:ribonuclease HI
MDTDTVIAATDGSCLGNPGPAGWAWVTSNGEWRSGGFTRATNNVAELTAIHELLLAVPASAPLELRTDSTYCLDALTKWVNGWRRNGWKTKAGTPVANAEIIRAIDTLLRQRPTAVTFVKVKAHMVSGGDPLNERADALATRASAAYRAGNGTVEGPGLS